jgi:hypothetical protein
MIEAMSCRRRVPIARPVEAVHSASTHPSTRTIHSSPSSKPSDYAGSDVEKPGIGDVPARLLGITLRISGVAVRAIRSSTWLFLKQKEQTMNKEIARAELQRDYETYALRSASSWSPVGIPQSFTLVIEADHSKRSCLVMWRNEKRIGVTFA